MPLPIGAFTAVPNPVMIGFMGVQMFYMSYQMGVARKYAERTIDSMSNEQFNKLRDNPQKMIDKINRDMEKMEPQLMEMMRYGSQYTDLLVAETGKVITQLIDSVAVQTNDYFTPEPGTFAKESANNLDVFGIPAAYADTSYVPIPIDTKNHTETKLNTPSIEELKDRQRQRENFDRQLPNMTYEQLLKAFKEVPFSGIFQEKIRTLLSQKKPKEKDVNPFVEKREATTEEKEFNVYTNEKFQLIQGILKWKKLRLQVDADIKKARGTPQEKYINSAFKQMSAHAQQESRAREAYKQFLLRSRNSRNAKIKTDAITLVNKGDWKK